MLSAVFGFHSISLQSVLSHCNSGKAHLSSLAKQESMHKKDTPVADSAMHLQLKLDTASMRLMVCTHLGGY